jgi:hypothetical protein
MGLLVGLLLGIAITLVIEPWVQRVISGGRATHRPYVIN